MDPQTPPRAVADLAGARTPADHGLASLGLLMQLVGGVMLGLMAMTAMTPLFGGQSAIAWPMFLLGASGVVRSVYHRMAGAALIYGSPRGHLHPVKLYIGVALGETLVWVYVFKSQLGMPGSAVAAIALLLVAWPLTLAAVLAWPRVRRFAHEPLPVAEDMGFEGASVLMALLGAIGLAMTFMFLLTILRTGGGVLASGPGLLTMGTLVLLAVRSALHVSAGVKGTRGIDSDGATDAAMRYFNFGVVSSVLVGAAMMILLMMTALHPVSLILCALLVYLLLAWPLILRRFFTERNFAAMLAGHDAPNHRRAPDAGLTALGWLLLGSGVYGLASAIPQALFGAEVAGVGLAGLLPMDGGVMADTLTRSAWWSVAMALVQIWAATELVRMTDRYRLAGTLYGVLSTAAALWIFWPMLDAMSAVGGLAPGMDGVLRFGLGALQLVLPVGTLILVNRKLTPQAQARFRAPS